MAMEAEITIQSDSVYKTEKGTPVTDSVRVAKGFGKKHKHILEAIRNLLGSAENSAHLKWFYRTAYLDTQGKQQPMYVMNRDGFSLLAMGLTGERALTFKVQFIEQFNAMEKALKQMQPQAQTPAIPQSFAEALRLAAAQAEAIEQQQKRIEAQEAVIEQQAPKVRFAESVETSKQSILIRELAKLIKQNGIDMGEIRLYKWLRENGYLCVVGSSYNQPTQKAMDMGLFELKKTTITKPNGETMVSTTTKVTGKGQVYFINKFLYNQEKQSQ